MLRVVKRILIYSLIIVSSITFIISASFYWLHISNCPLSSYTVVSFMWVSLVLKMYYFIPICFAVCILMFFSALSIKKEKILLPIILFPYLCCDMFFLSYNFFDAWFNNGYFIPKQMIQLVISVAIIVLMIIYFILIWKARRQKRIENDIQC